MILHDNFSEAHRTMMKLSPKDALDFVTGLSYSKKLVQSLPEESFYFFITSIGINDAGPILALGSEKQWGYLLDMEIWDKESLDYLSFTNLLILMMQAASQKFMTWCFYKKKRLIKLYLFRNIRIIIQDNDDENPDIDDNSFTNDGVFYLNPINYDTLYEHECSFLEERNMMIKEMLLRFSNMDYVRYQNLLLEVAGVIPAELEEELLRFRNVKLAEKGFLPFYEAVGIYQPIKFEDIERKEIKIFRKSNKFYGARHTIPYFPADMSRGENLFSKALKSIDDNTILQKLKIELGALCNLVISADNKKIRSYNDLKNVVTMVNYFLNIGIEIMFNKLIQQNIVTPSDIIKSWGLNDIFRLGYNQVSNLNKRVKDWYENSWFISQKLKLYFWREHWFGLLGGILLSKPMFFNKSSLMYRSFREYRDVYETEKVLDQITVVDGMFNQFNLDLSPFTRKYNINMDNLLLSMWFLDINDLNKGENLDFYPIPLKMFKLFYDDLWEELNGYVQVKNTKKIDLFTWVSDKMNLKVNYLPKGIILFLNKLLQELKEELSEVSAEDLDPRYIKIFVIEY